MIRIKAITRFLDVIEDKDKNIIIQNDRSIARFIIDTKRILTNVLFITTLRELHRKEFNFNNVKKFKKFRFRDRFF